MNGPLKLYHKKQMHDDNELLKSFHVKSVTAVSATFSRRSDIPGIFTYASCEVIPAKILRAFKVVPSPSDCLEYLLGGKVITLSICKSIKIQPGMAVLALPAYFSTILSE